MRLLGLRFFFFCLIYGFFCFFVQRNVFAALICDPSCHNNGVTCIQDDGMSLCPLECCSGKNPGLTKPHCTIVPNKGTYTDGEYIYYTINAGDNGEVDYGASRTGGTPTVSGACSGAVGWCGTGLCGNGESQGECVNVCTGTHAIAVNSSGFPQTCTITAVVANSAYSGVDAGTCTATVTVNSTAPPPPGPNLYIRSMSVAPYSGPSASSSVASVTVKNNGTVDVPGNFQVSFKRQGLSLACGQGNQFATVNGLNAGQQQTVDFNFNRPGGAGTYTAVAMVDSGPSGGACQIAETDETDNVKTTDYDVCDFVPPTQARLVSPADGSTIASQYSANLDWARPASWGSACPDDKHYYLNVWGPSLSFPPDWDANKTSFYPLIDLECGQTYTWRVDTSIDGGVNKTQGNLWSFTTAACYYKCDVLGGGGTCQKCTFADGCLGDQGGCNQAMAGQPCQQYACVANPCPAQACVPGSCVDSGGCDSGNPGSFCGPKFFLTRGGNVTARTNISDVDLPVTNAAGTDTQFVATASKVGGVVGNSGGVVAFGGTFAPLTNPPSLRYSQGSRSFDPNDSQPGWNLDGYVDTSGTSTQLTSQKLLANALKNAGLATLKPCDGNLPAPNPGFYLWCYTSNLNFESTVDQAISNSGQNIVVPSPNVMLPLPVSLSSSKSISGTRTVTIFVNGDLTLNANVGSPVNTSGLAFVVDGNLIVDSAVTDLAGLYVFSGNFNDNLSTTDTLTVDGMVIGTSEDPITGPFNLGAGSTLARTPTAPDTPGEDFNYNGKYLVLFKDLLARPKVKWLELPPH